MVCAGNDRPAANGPAVGHHPRHLTPSVDLPDEHLLRQDVFAEFHAVAAQFVRHPADEEIGAAAKGEDSLAHEVGKHDAEGDRRVVQRGAIGVGDRFHQQAHHLGTAREITLQHLPRRLRVVVVEIHRPQVVEEPFHGRRRHLETLDQQAREVRPVVGRLQGELRIHEPDALQLDNGIGDVLRPVFADRFDHADRETVQRDVEDMAAFPGKPRGQAAQLVVMFEQQDLVSAFGEAVGGGEAAEAAADHDDVIVVTGAFKPVVSHETQQ